MKILITDKVDPIFLQLLEKNAIEYNYELSWSRKKIIQSIINFNGLVIRNKLQIDTSFLDKAKNLKFIARYGSGMENIDTKKASDLDILCFNAAEGNRDAVAEHALGLLLCVFNNINRSMQQLKLSIWDREGNRGHELAGKTIGIIGYGNTGSSFAKKLKSFNCKVIAYDKYKSGFSVFN